MDRYIKCATHYLNLMGKEVIGQIDQCVLYLDEDGDIHVAIVRQDWEEPPITPAFTRPLLKKAMSIIFEYDPDVRIRFDYIGIMADPEENRAIVQHHINVTIRSDEDE